MAKIIEFICARNNSLSPVAEVLARDYLHRIGALGEYDSASSGTLVSGVASNKMPIEAVKSVVKHGFKKGLCPPAEIEYVRKALDSGDENALRRCFAGIENSLLIEDRRATEEVLKDFGFMVMPKRTRDQTVVRTDAVAIFPFDNGDLSRVREIYKGLCGPLMNLCSSYATGRVNIELHDAFGTEYPEVYRQCVGKMMREVPKAIDRLLGRVA